MTKEYGEPIRHDPTFDGPIHNRSCTDILWLILFILFLGGWGFVGYYGISNGNMERLVAPMDSTGRRCGLDSGLEDKKYLVFFNILDCLSPKTPIVGCPTPQVCVNKCPSQTITFDSQEKYEKHKSNMVCTAEVNVNEIKDFREADKLMNDKKCARVLIQSKAVFGRCFVNVTEALTVTEKLAEGMEDLIQYYTVNSTEIGTDISSQMTSLLQLNQISAQIVNDLVQSRWYLLGALFVVLVICFIYILVLRWVVAPIVWASIAGLLALLGYSLYLCYNNYVYYKENQVNLISTTNAKDMFRYMLSKYETWMVLLIVVAVIFVVLLLVVIFLRSRIVIAIALIKEGSKAVCAIKSTVFLPIFPWILQCVVIAYGVLILMYLMSIGESVFKVVNFKNDTCDCKGLYTKDQESCVPEYFQSNCTDINNGHACTRALCHYAGIENPNRIMGLQLINLLGFFWTMFFISGISDMMLASTFSTWYWTFNKKDVPFFTLTGGVYRTIRYHMGTVAFGSLIIAIVRVIRVILEYIDHKLKKFDNPFTRCIMCCCKCFFWCLESFLKFINKNAYIMCAVHGKHFCASARDAFSLLMRNIVRVVVLDKVTDFLFFLSKMMITIGVGFSVYSILDGNFVYEVTGSERLHFSYIPAIILSIATYLICTIFFNVYAMAVDTLFLCFLEDCERNDGSSEKPYFMSKNLMKILGKKNKKD